MTIFDLLLTKPVSKKADPLSSLGSVPQKGPSFESVLLSLLKKDHSLPNNSNTNLPFQMRSEPGYGSKDGNNKNLKLLHSTRIQPAQISSQAVPGQLQGNCVQKQGLKRFRISYDKTFRNTSQVNMSEKSDLLTSLPSQIFSKFTAHHNSKSVEQSSSKKSSILRSTNLNEAIQSEGYKLFTHQGGAKDVTKNMKSVTHRMRRSKQVEPFSTANQTLFAQKIENATPLPQMQEIKPEIKENSLRSSTKQIQKPLDDRKGAATLQKTETASLQTLTTPQTSFKEIQSELQIQKLEQEQKPHVARQTSLRSTKRHLLNENQQKQVLTQKSSLEHMKLENDGSQTQSLDNHSSASFATGPGRTISGLVSNSIHRSIAPSDTKTHITSKKGDHALGSLKRLDRKNVETEQMPRILFEAEKPQPKVVRNETQKPVEMRISKESNTDDSLLDHSPKSDHGSVESETVGMTHFEERNFEQHIMQKEVRFLKIDQARVQVRLQNDQLHLDFLSQAPLMTEGVEEYVEHVMQEHGFENYRIRLKDRKRDLLIQSQKSSTSHEARSMIDVKV